MVYLQSFLIKEVNCSKILDIISFVGKSMIIDELPINILNKEELERQLDISEVNHCLSFEQFSDEIIEEFNILHLYITAIKSI